ncbi:conserved protein of unknown function [Bradyrhizobium sp. ORS 285]|uniref:hypothetical protein n=1 Tax=Bradyrhizobium sp. ORS 285 TaxID=115808 RepID=UPI0002408EB8|nr:hypothetical protein [Bradyrhizobium sp. ORS 285]CCD83953.1 conserved hypothetical protein [Bradyrhizobium sp. ORS 285]SMX61848.1 conserved protein of unknown function [Bradyrhizobium sp. ORS 285]
MPPDESDGIPPDWDQEEADGFVGQLVLVGITYVEPDGETVTSQVQAWGRIVSATPEGISITCEGKTWEGQTMTLPPDLQAFQPASPGCHTLGSTGETVTDPDLTTRWTVTEAAKS